MASNGGETKAWIRVRYCSTKAVVTFIILLGIVLFVTALQVGSNTTWTTEPTYYNDSPSPSFSGPTAGKPRLAFGSEKNAFHRPSKIRQLLDKTAPDIGFLMKRRTLTEKVINEWLEKILKLHQKFKPKTLNSCNNECIFEKEVCDARTLDQWEQILTSDKLKAVPLFSDNEYIFPWEKEYLTHPPLQDVKLLPNLQFSKVYHISENGPPVYDDVTLCKKNDYLTFRADLVDSYGNRRKFGGDEVRAWITDESATRSTTGSVKDMGNGTYLVTVKPLWTGTVKLNVAVVYPREYLRAALYHMKEGRHRFIYGMFSNKMTKASEVTICHTTPNIPGRPCVCNYTEWNRRPYYCGRPLDNRLTCKDWVSIIPTKGPIAKDYTPAEERMAATMSRHMDKATIKHDVVIIADENDEPTSPLPRCVDMNRAVSWDHRSPRGIWRSWRYWWKNERCAWWTRFTYWWYGGMYWESHVCKEPDLTSQWVKSCLKSNTVWMIGDSNLEHIKDSLYENVKFSDSSKGHGMWTLERRGYNRNENITVTFRGHEYPLFHYQTGGWIDLMNQGGIEDFLKKVPSTGNHVVVIHYNLHFSISHLSAIFQRLLSVRQAVIELLKRNPSVLVAIRGPHVASVEWQTNHLFGGDVQGRFILRILRDIFASLKEIIVFLDGWDMTTSLKNTKMHPIDEVDNAILRNLLAFKCGD